jgi:CBS domain-containing protein
MKLAAVLAAKGPRVFTIDPASSVRGAVARLAENNIGALIVLDAAGAPVGIISERDIIRALARGGEVLDARVDELMSSPVVTGTSNDDLEGVLRTMTSRRFRHLPVVDDGELVGMVTIADLVKTQANEFRGAVERLETRLLEAR